MLKTVAGTCSTADSICSVAVYFSGRQFHSLTRQQGACTRCLNSGYFKTKINYLDLLKTVLFGCLAALVKRNAALSLTKLKIYTWNTSHRDCLKAGILPEINLRPLFKSLVDLTRWILMSPFTRLLGVFNGCLSVSTLQHSLRWPCVSCLLPLKTRKPVVEARAAAVACWSLWTYSIKAHNVNRIGLFVTEFHAWLQFLFFCLQSV